MVDVNYAGSTGYGRGYRERLTGLWGVPDVSDCLDAARFLVEAGEVDERRLVISGESAGGFTALCGLASEELFAGGASWFGIADLETFRRQAPKFQAHELDRLVGPYPEAAATYRAAHRCISWTGLSGRCYWCMAWRTPWCRRCKLRSWPRRLSAGAFGTSWLPFPGRGMGFAGLSAFGAGSRLSFPSTLKRWGWRPPRPTGLWPPVA